MEEEMFKEEFLLDDEPEVPETEDEETEDEETPDPSAVDEETP